MRGTGIEIVEEQGLRGGRQGVTVYHGDFAEVFPYYPDNSFDYVILSQTLQRPGRHVAVLNEALRVGQVRGRELPELRALEGAAAAACSRAGRR